jgi:hypothetical protein
MKRGPGFPNSGSLSPVAIKIPSHQAHPSRSELVTIGKVLRDKCARKSHADWIPPHDRPSPVHLVKQSDHGPFRI